MRRQNSGTCSASIAPSALFVNVIPEHSDAFARSWHEFKTSTVVEIRLLHSLPFMKSHLHFALRHRCGTGDVSSVASVAQTVSCRKV
jgi:hypothetical protein